MLLMLNNARPTPIPTPTSTSTSGPTPTPTPTIVPSTADRKTGIFLGNLASHPKPPEHPRYYHDPGGHKAAARAKRIREMVEAGVGADLPHPEILAGMIYDHEEAPGTTDIEQLRAKGFDPPPVSAFTTKKKLRRGLKKLIHELAKMDVYLHFTNHLDDRSLYRVLVEEVLHSERLDIPMAEGAAWHVDCSEWAPNQTDPDRLATIYELDIESSDELEEVSDRDDDLPGAGF